MLQEDDESEFKVQSQSDFVALRGKKIASVTKSLGEVQ